MAKKSPAKDRQPPLTTGWLEHVDLPELDMFGIVAKIDTGARTSALHVDQIRPYDTPEGEHRAIITIHRRTGGPKRGKGREPHKWDLPVREYREVKSSNGKVEKRAVIRTQLTMGGRTYNRDFTLTNRAAMRYEILVGRASLRRAYLVDPAGKFLLDPPAENNDLNGE